jgi:hypothetical protein
VSHKSRIIIDLDNLPDEMLRVAGDFVEQEVNQPNFEMGVAMEPHAFAAAVIRAALSAALHIDQ